MGTVVVNVMLKAQIADPAGRALASALPAFGFDQFSGARQGKRFVLSVDGEVTAQVLAAARRAAEVLLSSPEIEDIVSVRDGGDDMSTDWEDLDQPWGSDSPDETPGSWPRASYARHAVTVDADVMGEAHDAFGVDTDGD